MEYLIDRSNKGYTGTVALAGETAGGVRVRLDFFACLPVAGFILSVAEVCIKAKRKVKIYKSLYFYALSDY